MINDYEKQRQYNEAEAHIMQAEGYAKEIRPTNGFAFRDLEQVQMKLAEAKFWLREAQKQDSQ